MNMISRDDGLMTEARRQRRPRFRGTRRVVPVIVVAILLAGVAAWQLGKPSAPPAGATLPVVAVAAPLQRQVTEWDDYVGRFAPSQTVEIRPRVSGAVTEIHFRDGDIVQKDQLLFIIDPRPFDATLNEAKAGVATASSALALARSDLARALRLHGDEAISGSEIDSLRAHVDSAAAELAAAQARQDARALDVEFTQVRAPIAGRISDRRVDIGNLVTGGNSGTGTLLTTVNALDPIYFSFDGSEALYLKAQRQRQPGAPPPVAEIRLQDETGYAWKGAIDFTDNGLDTRSGTIRGRAVIANPDYFLTPGMFGNMRMAAGGTVPALLVPEAAVQTDQARKIVMTVDADDKVAVVPVEIGPVVDGLRIIRSGLAPDAKVVVGGLAFAIPGTKVGTRAETVTPTPDPTQPAREPISAQATFADR